MRCRGSSLQWMLALLASACTGPVDDSPGGPGGQGGDGDRSDLPGQGGRGGGAGVGAGPLADRAGRLPMARLTAIELDNTVRDLLGSDTRPSRTFPVDARGVHGFSQATPVADVVVARLMESSASLAESATKDLNALFRCDTVKEGEDPCVRRFISEFGLRAFRRPLTAGEKESFEGLDGQFKSTEGYVYRDRLRVLTRAFLLSPEFLYRGPLDGAAVSASEDSPLAAYELATRLSYFLWRSMPDAALFASAGDGSLLTAKGLEAQVERMVADERGRATVNDFHRQWLHLEKLSSIEKDPDVYPQFNPTVRAAMVGEFDRAVADWFAAGATLRDFFQTRTTHVEPVLAGIYGRTVPAQAGRLELDGEERSGILTQLAFLATHADLDGSKPVARGLTIYTQLLCGVVPPPPPNLPDPEPAQGRMTTRERFSIHADQACARGCHSLMDPLGFAFEHYDGMGAYRQMEVGKPIDASGAAEFPTEGTKPFKHAIDLMGALAESKDVRDCLARQWFRFAVGRRELPEEEASLAMASASAGTQFRIANLVKGVAKSRGFTHRSSLEAQP